MRLPDRPGTGPDLPGAQRGRPDDALGRPDADGAAAAGAERASLRFRELADRLARLSEAHPSARDDSVAAAGAHGGQVSGGSVSGGSVSGGEAWWRGELPAAPPDSGPRAGQAAAGEEPGGSGSGAAAQAEIPGAGAPGGRETADLPGTPVAAAGSGLREAGWREAGRHGGPDHAGRGAPPGLLASGSPYRPWFTADGVGDPWFAAGS